MSIRQLNATYVHEEDRVLMRLTTLGNEEYRLWLTRATVGVLLHQTESLAIHKLARDPHIAHAPVVAKLQQQALAQGVQYAQFESASRLPLGAEPVLVKGVKAALDEATPLLVLQLAGGQNLRLRLSDDVLGKIQLLMQRMDQAARWALQPQGQSLPSSSLPEAQQQAPLGSGRPEPFGSPDEDASLDGKMVHRKLLH